MKATSWKAVFAAMNPSPVFEAIAEFAYLRTEQDSELPSEEQKKLAAVALSER
jgi:hypothetical protein